MKSSSETIGTVVFIRPVFERKRDRRRANGNILLIAIASEKIRENFNDKRAFRPAGKWHVLYERTKSLSNGQGVLMKPMSLGTKNGSAIVEL
ncbi:MAG TPA: hypothetical protein DCP92_16170 [Nitrospiraceae bacterium]|jgi:hypothetical protein|nr:hypothetical protein [Nitrospiraceae bacterium]